MPEKNPSSPIPVTIRLGDAEALAHGSEKVVYLHPDRPDWVVKVREFRRDGQTNPWWDRALLHLSKRHEMHWLLREIEASAILMNQPDRPNVPLPVAIYHGLEMTDLGPAVIAQRVSLPKHPLGLRLWKIKRTNGLKQTHVDALNEFVARAVAWNVPMTDPNPGNLIFGQRGSGRREIVLVDGFGDYSLLHWRIRSSRINSRINARKFKALADRLELDWDKKTMQFRLRNQS